VILMREISSSVMFVVLCGQVVKDRHMVTLKLLWAAGNRSTKAFDILGDLEVVILRSRKLKWPVTGQDPCIQFLKTSRPNGFQHFSWRWMRVPIFIKIWDDDVW
jgi:hypothetical protein